MKNDQILVQETSYEQVIKHEQQEIKSSSYWKKVSELYPKVFDGMEYTAYIASGHNPL